MILLAFGSTGGNFDASSIVGTKGNWSQFIKDNFMNGCMAERPDELTEEMMRMMCQCSMDRIEARYAPEELETAEAQQFAGEVGQECAIEVTAG